MKKSDDIELLISAVNIIDKAFNKEKSFSEAQIYHEAIAAIEHVIEKMERVI